MRKLIRKGQVGLQIPQGGLYSFTPTPPNLASLIPGLDLSSFKLQTQNPITKKTILGQQFTFNKTNIGSTANIAGGALDMINSFLPYGEVEQSGAIKGISTGLNVVSDIASNIPGIGQAVGLGADVLNTVLNAVDLLGAKKADTITKNTQAFETVGASYGGTSATVDSALEKSGKKYGLMNGRGRRKANDEIARAKMQQQTMSEIADDATQRFNIQSSMSDINNRRYGLSLQGGYKQQAVRVGKLGMKVISNDQIKRARTLLAQKGAKVKPKYNDWVKTVPQDRLSPLYDLEKAFEVLPFEMLESWRKSTPEQLDKGEFHLQSIYQMPDGNYEFLKLGTEKDNPEVHFETDTFYDGSNGLKESYDLIFNKDRNRYYYIRKKSQKFQDGGKMNVIPDGALHARLNHMDVDNITKKGIPVITQENGGEILQHAEIEKEEIIFTKAVTDQLEKLYRLGTDKAAIEAGKLLAIQIMENTQDNTGLMKEVV